LSYRGTGSGRRSIGHAGPLLKQHCHASRARLHGSPTSDRCDGRGRAEAAPAEGPSLRGRPLAPRRSGLTSGRERRARRRGRR